MKYLTVFAALVLIVAYFDSCSARSEPICGYTNSLGEMIFLRYAQYEKKGQDYVDFGTDGLCLKKATCLSTYYVQIDECADVKVNCDKKDATDDAVFPKCCIKC